MSFYGKKYQKVKIDNMIELLEKLNVGENTFSLMKHTDTTSTYEKNDDGSIEFTVKKGDQVIMNQKMENDKEVEFKNPDGVLIKSLSKIDGDVVKTYLTFPNGRKVELHRYFEGNSMRMEVIVPEFDTKGVVYYEAV